MTAVISHGHQSTYDAVFQHPLPHNLQWREVRSLLDSVADAVEEGDGNVKFTRNGRTLTVHPPRHKDFDDVPELMRIRQFLEESGAKAPPVVPDGMHLIVAIDHREARIYAADQHGSVAQRITPTPNGTGGASRYLHYVNDEENGQRRPEPKGFYEAVARRLSGAEKILIFGSGTGASSAMEHLLDVLNEQHAALAKRVVGAVVIDEQHITENQLLAKAREYLKPGGLTPTAPGGVM
jgi:hypothetical protein